MVGKSVDSKQALSLEHVSVNFGGLRAIADVSFEVDAGEVVGLIGPNGAGKTTAFDTISGVVAADSGSIKYDGAEIGGLMPHRVAAHGIGRTFQITRELGEMTVLENMVVPNANRGLRALIGSRIDPSERDHAMEVLDFVGIAGLADLPAKLLSYGQKKLLELASILMTGPRLVLLDEPAGGVNPALMERIMDRIETLNAGGTTFLIVEHNMDVVMRLSHSIIVMAHGQVILQETPEVVREDPRVLEAYLGGV
jgi:branched-chain amino acid transport system ATP-binding protein